MYPEKAGTGSCAVRSAAGIVERLGILSALVVSVALPLPAAIIGTNTPARPLTAERVASLPAAGRKPWEKYLARSSHQRKDDQQFLASELRRNKLSKTTMPPQSSSTRSIPLNQPESWYGQSNALRIADIILSFQTPAGGWSKNLNMSSHRRAPGELFAPGNGSRYLSPGDFDAPLDDNWHYVGTFDNDATATQLRFLARVVTALNSATARPYRAAFLRGLDYIFAAQYPNGGWPQVWPLEGGYHDAITLNDDAMVNILELLRSVAGGTGEFAFVPAKFRKEAEAGIKHGIGCILATQVVVDGQHTVWCQQNDPFTLEPCSARNYEMPSLTSAESAGIVLFLMDLPNPSPEVIASVKAAVAWFEKTRIKDVAYRFTPDQGRRLVSAPGNGPLWSRYYEIGTDRPIFGDRDKTIHDDVNEISRERRNGYGWYRDTPQRALERYGEWERQHR